MGPVGLAGRLRQRILAQLQLAMVDEQAGHQLARIAAQPGLGRQQAQLERGHQAAVARALAGREGAHAIGPADAELLAAVQVVQRPLAAQRGIQQQTAVHQVLQPVAGQRQLAVARRIVQAAGAAVGIVHRPLRDTDLEGADGPAAQAVAHIAGEGQGQAIDRAALRRIARALPVAVLLGIQRGDGKQVQVA
jgi:hypothetical protein